jgi:hypothetical protein
MRADPGSQADITAAIPGSPGNTTADFTSASRTSALDLVLNAGEGSMAITAADLIADITSATPDSSGKRIHGHYGCGFYGGHYICHPGFVWEEDPRPLRLWILMAATTAATPDSFWGEYSGH